MNTTRVSLLLIAVSAALVSACRRDEITVQRVPKEVPPAVAMGAAGGAPLSAPAHDAEWTAPAGWKKLAPSQMRAASYSVPSAGGPIDVSVVPLTGDAGGNLANINRWRGQLGLPPLTEAELAGVARRQTVGKHPALVVEFASTDAPLKRLLAAVIPHDNVTWFFKAVGPDADVAKLKPAFLSFAGSLRFQHHHE